jgi:soluble lytic murein transglycosylase-like protein
MNSYKAIVMVLTPSEKFILLRYLFMQRCIFKLKNVKENWKITLRAYISLYLFILTSFCIFEMYLVRQNPEIQIRNIERSFNQVEIEPVKIEPLVVKSSSPSYNPVWKEYAEKIISTSKKEWGENEEKLGFEDAIELIKKIEKAAEKYQMDLKTALALVDVESSFNAKAKNKKGEAYGLCQVTSPCLTQYNWKHGTNYTLEDMYNEDLNLEVGFWYYKIYILSTCNKEYDFITTNDEWKTFRDAYIAYNIGVTTFDRIGKSGRNSLRQGTYPNSKHTKKYGKAGSVYKPVKRCMRKAKEWGFENVIYKN